VVVERERERERRKLLGTVKELRLRAPWKLRSGLSDLCHTTVLRAF